MDAPQSQELQEHGNMLHIKKILCLDDFGIRHWSKDDADHLCNSVRKNRHTVDKDGNNYCGLTLHWNYPLGYVDHSMHNYMSKSLTGLNYKPKTTPQHSPHKHVLKTDSKKGERQMINSNEHKKLPSNKTHTVYLWIFSLQCSGTKLQHAYGTQQHWC